MHDQRLTDEQVRDRERVELVEPHAGQRRDLEGPAAA